MFTTFLVITVVAAIGAPLVIAYMLWRGVRRGAWRSGHASVGEYLRASPRSDEEKKGAVDLALKGLLICMVGIIFPPLLLVGVFPLFFGTRKIIYASMGLGLFDDGEHPGA